MLLEIIVCVLIIGVVAAFGLKYGIDWQKGLGRGMGQSHMKELGLEEEKKEHE